MTTEGNGNWKINADAVGSVSGWQEITILFMKDTCGLFDAIQENQ